jgi:hypothetical protein
MRAWLGLSLATGPSGIKQDVAQNKGAVTQRWPRLELLLFGDYFVSTFTCTERGLARSLRGR